MKTNENMKIEFDPDSGNVYLQREEIEEVIQKIPPLINSYSKKIMDYASFVDKEFQCGRYIEIHMPLFELDLSVTISKIKEKFLLSVLDHMDSKVYGNLIIDEIPCIKVNELKNYGTWSNYCENKLSVFKPL